METQNVTLSLPKAVVKRLKIIAARRETSMSRLLSSLLEDLVRSEDAYSRARIRELARMKKGLNLGVRSDVTRDELHER